MVNDAILNELSRYISKIHTPVVLKNNDDCVLEKSKYGDIGIDTTNDEITIYGLGAHSHYFFLNGDGQLAMDMKLTKVLLKSLLSGKTLGYSVYVDGRPQSGGFVRLAKIKTLIMEQNQSGNLLEIRFKDKICKYGECG